MKNCLAALLIFCSIATRSQETVPAAEPPSKVENGNELSTEKTMRNRQLLIGSASVAGYGGSFVFLSTAWYKDYPRRSFHTFDDSKEWLQVDKAGHAWTTYHTSRFTTNMWRWAGVNDNKALLFGTGSSLLYMLSVEYLDGHSTEWGWSWADVGANFFGAALYAGQELGWKAQKIGVKFSAHYQNYGQPDLTARADKLYGSSFQGRLLKDYNAQTYWLSANLKSFLPKAGLPSWLNVSIGYGADGMFGGFENIGVDRNDGNITFDRRDIRRQRQWYLSPDVDFTKIKTKSKLLKSVFSAANVLKFPAPALRFSNGKFSLQAIAF